MQNLNGHLLWTMLQLNINILNSYLYFVIEQHIALKKKRLFAEKNNSFSLSYSFIVFYFIPNSYSIQFQTEAMLLVKEVAASLRCWLCIEPLVSLRGSLWTCVEQLSLDYSDFI